MLVILSLLLAKETSMPPPDIMTRITGPLDAFATSLTSCCCCPGSRMLTLSRLSASIARFAPTTIMVASADAAIFTASSIWALAHCTSGQPGA
ncbi:beta-xylosidase/alpha-L-arabinofuranosidase [Trifolium repens]|nr:beta-xylosidase/alpha-L-arabinofuranosidase [Trifolium repens]